MSLALSALIQRPVEINNIRANRPNPGLRPQHLACVNMIKQISNSNGDGGNVGSTVVT